jgi:site-specific DNA recombinase
MRVAAYARVSTTRQAQAQGIEQQLDRLRAAAAERGWDLDDQHVYRDDGYSGARIGRPGLDRLRDRAALADLDLVLVTAPDRLARNYVHQVLLIDELAARGCRVEFLDRPMSSDPHDQLLLQIRGAVAEYERTLIAERMRRGRQAKLRAGTLLPWTTAPFGYRLDPERPRRADAVRTEPGEAALVAQLFDWYLEPQATVYRLAARLTDLGAPTPRGGPRWNTASVRGILRNPSYAGRALSNRTQVTPARARKSAMLPAGPGISHAPRPEEDWIAVPVPPVVSEQTFAQVQAKLDANQQGAARNTRHEYLLRALISCGACRLGCTGRQTAAGYRYYLCRGRTDPLRVAQGERCTARYIPAGQLDELVWADLCALLTDPAHVTRALARAQDGAWLPQELQARQATVRQALGQLERQQQRLLDAYLAEVVTLPELERKRQDLDRRRATLCAQQRQLDAAARQKLELGAVADGIEAFCQTIRAGLATATFEQRRLLAELLIDRVVITDGEAEIRYVLPTSPDGPHRPFCQLRKDHLDAPPGGVPFDQGGGGGSQVGGDQGQRGDGAAGQDDPDRGGVQAAVPQAGDLGQVLGGVPAVDPHHGRGPGRGGGYLGPGAGPGALARWPAGLADPGRRQGVQHRVLGQPGRPGHGPRQVPQRRPVVMRVRDHVHRPPGKRPGQQRDQRHRAADRAGRRRLPAGLAARAAPARDMQPGQHRQAHRPRAERQRHDDPARDEAIAEAELVPRRGRPVMLPGRPVHLAAGPAEHRVTDRHHQRLPGRDQQHHSQPRDRQAQLIEIPAGPGEEVMRPVMRPAPAQARPGQHPAHRPPPHLPGQPRHQPAERHERRPGEHRTQRTQQIQQRNRQIQARKHRRIPSHEAGTGTADASPFTPPDQSQAPHNCETPGAFWHSETLVSVRCAAGRGQGGYAGVSPAAGRSGGGADGAYVHDLDGLTAAGGGVRQVDRLGLVGRVDL